MQKNAENYINNDTKKIARKNGQTAGWPINSYGDFRVLFERQDKQLRVFFLIEGKI